jgi:hypothetical protein
VYGHWVWGHVDMKGPQHWLVWKRGQEGMPRVSDHTSLRAR